MSPSKTTEIDGFQTIWRSKSDHPGIQALKTAAMSPRPLSTPVNAAVQLDGARPIILHTRSATCWQPYVKNVSRHANSIYNNWRMDDWWLDK